MEVMIILGARPQFIKTAPIVRELLKVEDIELQLIHTGQHYDYELSGLFFEEMDIPSPAVNLRVGSGSQAVQTGRAMVSLENCMLRAKPDLVLVPGDTNSTLAGALAAAKLGLKVAHVEAGARSYDMSMPEEINRRLTDHVSSLLFAPTRTAARNLHREGIPDQLVRITGDTLVDALRTALPRVSKLTNQLLSRFGIRERDYVLVTAHRPGNVDDPIRLGSIVDAIMEISEHIKVIFPAHPRAVSRLRISHLINRLKRCSGLILTRPVGYIELVALLDKTAAVLTDSGGLQREAFLLDVPCLTMRSLTEWPETLANGANVLVDVHKSNIPRILLKRIEGRRTRKKPVYSRNPFGDGKASIRIVNTILQESRHTRHTSFK